MFSVRANLSARQWQLRRLANKLAPTGQMFALQVTDDSPTEYLVHIHSR